MAYATLEQLIEAYGISEVSQLLCDENGLVTEPLVNDAIASGSVSSYSQQEQDAVNAAIERADNILERQSTFIDSKISGRYLLPLINDIDSPVVECCLVLARAALADDGTNISKRVIEERDYWRKWLGNVANGTAHLLGERAVNNAGAERRYITRKPRSLLDKLVY